MPTPLRNVRVPDDLWSAVLAKAATEGTNASAVVVTALRAYVAAPDSRKPPASTP